VKQIYLACIAALAALIVFGCGGGGPGGGTGGNLTNIRVEAVLASNPSIIKDPLNIQVGEQIQFQVVGYDEDGKRVVLSSSAWQSGDTTGQAGTLTSGGLFTATASSAGTKYSVSGFAAGQRRFSQYEVKPVQAEVTGRVVDSTSFTGVGGVTIRFYNNVGAQVGSSTTAFDGTFRASVPASATRFHLDPTTIPIAYYNNYTYSGLRYASTIATCTAPLPALANGVTTALAGDVSVPRSSGPPPPPPNGCT
jgi:hypothetical protein